jgi:hypothetical protein
MWVVRGGLIIMYGTGCSRSEGLAHDQLPVCPESWRACLRIVASWLARSGGLALWQASQVLVHQSAGCTVNLPPSLRPKTSGKYIS